MARGAMSFDGERLRLIRMQTPVQGRLLSVAELARQVGTSKARIYAYEKNQSVPEAARIRQLAQTFGLTTRAFASVSDENPRPHIRSVQELRCEVGLTAAQAAAEVGISRTTYREVEGAALLPSRDDGSLPLRMAAVFKCPLRVVHDALDLHPAAGRRRRMISTYLEEIFERATVLGTPAVVDVLEAPLRSIAHLLRLPPATACRLVNYELTRHRRRLREKAVMEVNMAYNQGERHIETTTQHLAYLEKTIEAGPTRAARSLTRFLSESMSSRQWRALVTLIERVEITQEWSSRDPSEVETWEALEARELLTMEYGADGKATYRLSDEGRRVLGAEVVALYGCLYPRVPSPRLPRPVRPPGRSRTATSFL